MIEHSIGVIDMLRKGCIFAQGACGDGLWYGDEPLVPKGAAPFDPFEGIDSAESESLSVTGNNN